VNYFEDVAIGEVMALGGHTFTAEEIKAFAHRFDPQPFHMDEVAARESHFGALCASGWHTSAVWMRLMVEYRRRLAEAALTRGEPVAAIGPALGFRDLKWHKPVYANDTISYQSEIVDKRLSRSKPSLGLLSVRATGVNQHGEIVLSFVSTTFLERRPEVP
jgi:acyl dehydratase